MAVPKATPGGDTAPGGDGVCGQAGESLEVCAKAFVPNGKNKKRVGWAGRTQEKEQSAQVLGDLRTLLCGNGPR